MSREPRRRSNPRPGHRLVWLAVGAAALGAAAYAIANEAENAPGRGRAINRVQPWAHARVPEKRRRPAQFLSLPKVLQQRTVWLPILMYHRVGPIKEGVPAITRALTVTSQRFSAQMHWLVAHRFHAVTQLQAFNALERGETLPPRPVMITFDDGYRDVLWNAAPILRRLRLPATAYVITSRVSGADPSFLTWQELRRLEAAGVTIGSHTVHHRRIPSLSTSSALKELTRSRRALERHLGHFVQWFAYPFGAVNVRTVRLVRQAGYVLAVTTQGGATQNASEPLELRRYEVLDATGVAGLRALVDRAR